MKRLWAWLRRSAPIRPATVICFDCRGCMAQDHRLLWIGEVVGHEPTRYAGEAMRVRVLKCGDECGDFRDRDLGIEIEALGNSGLQEVRPGLFFLYK